MAENIKCITSTQKASEEVTDYLGSVIYENGVLKMILTPEGYITLSGTTPTYHCYLRDPLGNNRVVVSQSGTVTQVNHYYPFGGLFGEGTATSAQPYKYNDKELDRTNGLDLYDYSARYMDAALGQFTTVDPMAEKYYSISPYAYVGNNPVNAIDPDGMDWYRIKDKDGNWKYKWTDEIHSQEALDKIVQGAEHLGKTHTENGVYYSLFGTQVNSNSIEGELYKLVDKAIIQNAEDVIEGMKKGVGETSMIDLSIESLSNIYFLTNFTYEGSYFGKYQSFIGKNQ